MLKVLRSAAFAAFSLWVVGAAAHAQTPDAVSDEAAAAEEGATEAATPAPGDPSFFDRDPLEVTPTVCPFKGRISYNPRVVSCGLLSVPENREKARSRMIQLLFIKIAAKASGEQRDDAIVHLVGGPGGMAPGYAAALLFNHKTRNDRDIYVLEQRGIGFSDEFCPFVTFLNPADANASTPEAVSAAQFANLETCFARARAARVDLSGYNTIENARDVKALRKALGFDQWNVWGISYGTTLGQAVARVDPEGVRTLTLDAVAPLSPGPEIWQLGFHYERSLKILDAACKAHETCGDQFPDFIGRLRETAVRIGGAPVELDAVDPEIYPSGKFWLFDSGVVGAPFAALYNADQYAALPAMIEAFAERVERGELDTLRLLTTGAGYTERFMSQAMMVAVWCNDGEFQAMAGAADADREAYPVLGKVGATSADAANIVAICKRYGARARDPALYAPVTSDAPTLLVEGALDPITPPRLAKLIEPGFPNSTYVEAPYGGHGPSATDDCTINILIAFLNAPERAPDAGCQDAAEPPAFIDPLFVTDAVGDLALAFAENPQSATPSIALAISSVVVLLFAALTYTVSPVATVLVGARAYPTGGARPLAWLVALLGVGSALALLSGIAASAQASPFVLLLGLLGWTRWAIVGGLVAGALGLLLLVMTVRARGVGPMPANTLLGLVATGVSAVGFAWFLIDRGFLPF
ncbi:MAG: alpha/beta hydrolase [Pseudomonadota bacterium]